MNSKLLTTIFFAIFLLSSISAIDIANCTDLQNMNLDLSGNYTLLNNIDCSDTINWNAGAGFLPVGDSSNHFLGNFDGAGFNITDLFINRSGTDYQGLFGYAGDTGDNGTMFLIQNVGLINVNVTGGDEVGALCGYAEEINISNSFSTGNILGNYKVGGLVGEYFDNGLDSLCSENCGTGNLTNSFSSVNLQGNGDTGGLVGKSTGTYIKNSYASGNVVGINDGDYGYEVGGLVGYVKGCTILNSYSIGNVSGDAYEVGGLVGGLYAFSKVLNSYSTANVDGNSYIGGLVGYSNQGNINNSFSTGFIQGINTIGGLIGEFEDGTSCDRTCGINNISNSYSTSNVYGSGGAFGGLVGYVNSAYVVNSYATGNISGGDAESVGSQNAGGLVGYSMYGTILNSYATGDVNFSGLGGYVGGLSGENNLGIVENSYSTGKVYGTDKVGGLVGLSRSWYDGLPSIINNSYSIGEVIGDTNVGGLLGEKVDYTNTTNSFWDINTSGQLTSADGTGKTTEEMKVLPTFQNWTITETDVDLNNGYPYILNGVWFLFVSPSPEEIAQQFSETGQAIYDILNVFGAGFGIFLQILGQALPFLLIGLAVVVMVVIIIRKFIEVFETI